MPRAPYPGGTVMPIAFYCWQISVFSEINIDKERYAQDFALASSTDKLMWET